MAHGGLFSPSCVPKICVCGAYPPGPAAGCMHGSSPLAAGTGGYEVNMLPKSVYITGATSSASRNLFSCRCFQLLSDSRPHWHTTGKELRRPVQRHPISRGGAIAPSPPSPSANRVAVRHLPPRPSMPIGRPRRFFASSARPDVTCGAGVKSFQATEISVCGRGMGPEQSSMRQVDNFK